jgi:putative membrane protein
MTNDPDSIQEGRIVSSYKTCLTAAVLWLPLLLTAAATQDRPLIEKKPGDREPATDREFLTWAIACEVAEVKFAERAAKNADNADVRKLADKVLENHKKIRDALLEQAKKARLGVVEGLEKHHREAYDKLSKLDGNAFDREYLRYLVEGHEKGVKMYKKWAKDAKDADLRDVADRALTTAKDHLAQAKKMKESLKR